jgi:hypothetical protein
VINEAENCVSQLGTARMGDFFNSIAPRISMGNLFSNDVYDTIEVTRLNAPGQRFTATHGISGQKGQEKLFL